MSNTQPDRCSDCACLHIDPLRALSMRMFPEMSCRVFGSWIVWMIQPLSHDDAASIREISAQKFRHCSLDDFTCSKTIETNDNAKMMMTSHLSLITLGSLPCRECVFFQSFQPSWDFVHILPGYGRKCFEKFPPNQRPCFWSAGSWLTSAGQSGCWLWGQVTEAQRGSVFRGG